MVSVQDAYTVPELPWSHAWDEDVAAEDRIFTRSISYGYDALGRRVSENTVGEHPWDYYFPWASRGRGNDPEVSTSYEVTLYNGLSFDPLAQVGTQNYSPGLGFGMGWWNSWGHRSWRSWRGRWFFPFINRPNRDFETLEISTRANGEILMEASTADGPVKGNWFGGRGRRNDPEFFGEMYHHVDQLGSTIVTSDEHGILERRISYDAFGGILGSQIGEIDYGYNGKPYDENTGLYNYGFRDYNPHDGRFQTVDPIKDGVNWYAYVGNDPVNFIDPLGLDAVAESDGDQEDNDLQEVTPALQIPINPNDWHCDINSWNQAISQGYDPTPDSGPWDGNILTADMIAQLYPVNYETPPENTAGLGFINNDADPEYDHMIFYDNTDSDPNTYIAWDSNGIDDQTMQIYSIFGTTVANGIFVPLQEIED
jgi:RHS repeat-associated protein